MTLNTLSGRRSHLCPGGKGGTAQVYDLVLQAVGRTPNGKKIAADKVGVVVTDCGLLQIEEENGIRTRKALTRNSFCHSLIPKVAEGQTGQDSACGNHLNRGGTHEH